MTPQQEADIHNHIADVEKKVDNLSARSHDQTRKANTGSRDDFGR
jgi:hypothetical protein